jgi:hypothetical protein
MPSLPVTFQEITEAAAVEQQVVAPLRMVLDNSTATFTPTGPPYFESGERSHIGRLSPVKRFINKVFGRKP